MGPTVAVEDDLGKAASKYQVADEDATMHIEVRFHRNATFCGLCNQSFQCCCCCCCCCRCSQPLPPLPDLAPSLGSSFEKGSAHDGSPTNKADWRAFVPEMPVMRPISDVVGRDPSIPRVLNARTVRSCEMACWKPHCIPYYVKLTCRHCSQPVGDEESGDHPHWDQHNVPHQLPPVTKAEAEVFSSDI